MKSLGLATVLRRPALRAATAAYARLRGGGSERQGFRVLAYHAVGTPIEDDSRRIYTIAPACFELHMRHLAKHHAGKLVPLKSPPPLEAPAAIAVTFDDGYRDNLTMAAPLLVELGIPFSVFVCTGAVAARKTGFLDSDDLRKLASMPGATIGSHTISHPRLTECDASRVREELSGSKAFLEDLLGREIDALAYPHGAVTHRERDMAQAAGYRVGATSRFDINTSGRDPLLLCRTDIWADDDMAVFAQKLRGDWDWNRWRTADPELPERERAPGTQ